MFDETYPLRTRICGAIGIDILSSDAELFSAILSLTTKRIDMSEGIRIDLCNMLELDYLTSRDMDIYQAVALHQVEADALRARVQALENSIENIIQICASGMGEWASVQPPHLPAEMEVLHDVINELSGLLDNEKEGKNV